MTLGGRNFDRAHVAALLRTHAMADDAAVLMGANGRPDALLGPRTEMDADELIAVIASGLVGSPPAGARPIAYRVGAKLPRDSLGKPGDSQ